MELPESVVCTELILDLIYHELLRGRLSPEAEYLLERHLQECQSCRHKLLSFHSLLQEAAIVRNFG
jgi:hypothetical protein